MPNRTKALDLDSLPTSYWAERRPHGSIRYRVVDEYPESGSHYRIPIEESKDRLSLREMIELVDRTVHYPCVDETLECEVGLLEAHGRFERSQGTDPKQAVEFARFESSVYPELEAYFLRRGREWVESCEREDDSDL